MDKKVAVAIVFLVICCCISSSAAAGFFMMGSSSDTETNSSAAPAASAPAPAVSTSVSKWAELPRTDRGGADIKWGMNDLNTCKAECSKDSTCKAVVQIPSTGACGLKNDVSAAYTWDDRKMYLIGTGDFATINRVNITPGQNDIGINDSKNLDTCKTECKNNPNCKSFVVDKNQRCWYKSAAGPTTNWDDGTGYFKLA